MRSIFSSKILAVIFSLIYLNSCTDYAEKSDLLTKNGAALVCFYEHYREFKNKVGRKPVSIDELFQRFPILKSDLKSSYACDLELWVYYPDSSKEGIIIEASDKNESAKLYLMEDGHLMLK